MTYHLTIPTLVCSACADAVTRAIQSQDPQAQVAVNLETKTATIESDLAETLIREAIEGAGHELADFS
ncbi:MAG: heavy-metal-associated domain-containing protein [Cyanobacteriota bacterium]|jgi:copper chaperone